MTEKIYHKYEHEYTVIYDPIPCEEGGFRSGSYISKAEVEHMTRANFRAFSVGTIIQDSCGKRYIIRDKIGSNAQVMMEYD
jgi:hypothetical protein